MTLRIDRIKVNRGGPLESDFELEPGDLNLIYGQNETGKTYVVESLIKFLFKTNSRAPVDWDLRDWGIAGRAIVSGLESDSVPFTTGGKKLEDYWEEGPGLPPDLSRLLVVRAGETLLAGAKDGVGRDMLKDYLSGEGILDRVAEKVQDTLKDAEVGDGDIVGAARGQLKDRKVLKADVGGLQTLLDDVEGGYTSGDAYPLRQQKEELDVQAETLGKAKRYHAGQLAGQIKGLDGEKRELPTGEQLGELRSNIATYESNNKEIGTKSEKLEELESTKDDCQWAKEALGVYENVTSGAAGSGPKQILILLALLSLTGTVALPTPGLRLASAALSVLFVAIMYRDMKRALPSAGENTELERLKAEYRTRFGSDLTDRAALQAKLKELEPNQILATPLRKNIEELSDNTLTLERSITETLRVWTHTEVPVHEWRDHIQALKKKNADLQDQIDSIRDQLTKVGIPATEYLDQDPGEEWDPDRYAALRKELRVTAEALEQEEEILENLKARVSQKTGLEGSDWEELITVLRDKREEAVEEYRKLTAEILAKIQVHTAIEDLRQQENSRIAEGLKREELTEPLHALTGRYRRIRLDGDQGLVLVSDKDEDYRLAELSTGAREQVFLALRIGFASIAMEGKTGFLILDDAFQHSDWNRRKNLVTRTVRFVQSGWQVFYFTMDDHIRDLFQDAGDRIGDGFRSHRLGEDLGP